MSKYFYSFILALQAFLFFQKLNVKITLNRLHLVLILLYIQIMMSVVRNFMVRIIFMSILMTAFSQGADVKGYTTKYYCSEFSITPPQNQNWRDFFLAELTPEKYPLFFEYNTTRGAALDLMKYCPNFSNLSTYEKKIIILRLFDGMTFFESSCEHNVSAPGPNGVAHGILQLHLGREQDYARECKKYDAKNPKRSLTCSLNMLHDQVQNTQRIFAKSSYWDVLRPKARSNRAYTIASHLWYYPLCQLRRNK